MISLKDLTEAIREVNKSPFPTEVIYPGSKKAPILLTDSLLSTKVLGYLLGKNTERPVLKSIEVPNVSNRLFIGTHTTRRYGVSVYSNDLRITVLLSKAFKKNGVKLIPDTGHHEYGPKFFTYLFIGESFFYSLDKLNRVFEILVKFFKDLLFEDSLPGKCRFCGNNSLVYPNDLCQYHLKHVPFQELKNFYNTLKMDTSLVGMLKSDEEVNRILMGLKKFTWKTKKEVEKCIDCGKSLEWNMGMHDVCLCYSCDKKYDWSFFRTDYYNGLVLWKDFNSDPKIRKRYLRRNIGRQSSNSHLLTYSSFSQPVYYIREGTSLTSTIWSSSTST